MKHAIVCPCIMGEVVSCCLRWTIWSGSRLPRISSTTAAACAMAPPATEPHETQNAAKKIQVTQITIFCGIVRPETNRIPIKNCSKSQCLFDEGCSGGVCFLLLDAYELVGPVGYLSLHQTAPPQEGRRWKAQATALFGQDPNHESAKSRRKARTVVYNI